MKSIYLLNLIFNFCKLIRLILATFILIFSSNISHADFQFEKVTYYGDVDGEYINLSATFYNIITDALSVPIPTFTMGFDGNMGRGRFHSIRFDEASFPIPHKVSSDPDQPGRFFVYHDTLRDGSFRKFYNYMNPVKQSLIEAVCEHFLNVNEIKKMTSVKIDSIATDFLNFDHHKKDLKRLALDCLKPSKIVYARDIQNQLSKLGYSLGNINGEWGAKSEHALNQYFADRQISADTKMTTILLRRMQAELGELEQNNTLVGTGSNSQELTALKVENKHLKNFKKSINEKLQNRGTINVFRAWTGGKETSWDRTNPNIHRYNLYWNVFDGRDTPMEKFSGVASSTKVSPNLLNLHAIKWNMNYTYTEFDDYPGIDRYITKKKWFHEDEHGETVTVKFWDDSYPSYLSELAKDSLLKNNADGIMLDWWQDKQLLKSTGLLIFQAKKATTNIAKSLRNALGDHAIILGNVGWTFNKTTTKYINGVFLELYKSPGVERYNTNEIFKMESLLSFYDQNLHSPRLIAMAPWRVSKLNDPLAIPPDSKENIKYAKLFTAMAIVVPENGYILYSDNNWDTDDEDYGSVYYDFYDFDIGKPTSKYIKVGSGFGYKEHQRGFIAYNINSSKKTLTRANGQKFTIPEKSGLFCEDKGNTTECLPID